MAGERFLVGESVGGGLALHISREGQRSLGVGRKHCGNFPYEFGYPVATTVLDAVCEQNGTEARVGQLC